MKWALNSFWFHPTMDEDRMYQLVLSEDDEGILFTPPGFLRWHNLMTTSDLSAFSISAWWIDYKGNFHQIYLPVEDATLEIYMIFKDTF
ncbi:hypothetical protein FNF28_02531 [Cafeteria roenbergensis]|uniref:Uncharacterized protein n=1 Tax=Cafeteria roenbergensis TaxID=33653 RepID=A0A5A8CQM9_CAFRO|nr:hypothetical protein FNF28_07287 [Cafeteria roenbergensis]KAA0154837.1 hypothetical protein FNF28_06800 [Cafeteria roenbergensis]KAA0168234.1 hypothetical protein FNF28_02531 [Cafeteria roenbergensis]